MAQLPPAPHAPSADGPLLVVLNKRSGRHGEEDPATVIESILKSAGRSYQMLPVADASALVATAERAVALARELGGVVVAAGGDGTLSTVANVVLPTGLPFAVLPQGTFNYFGRANGISQDTSEATHALLASRVKPIQVGQVNGKLFLVNASIGLYPVLLEDREKFKARYGRTRVIAALASLWTIMKQRRSMLLRFDPDDADAKVMRMSTVFVGNNALQLQQVGLPEVRDVHQGRLAAVCVAVVGRLELLRLAMRGALGKLENADNVETFSFRSMEVQGVGRSKAHARRRMKVAMDGETFWMQSPLVFKVADQMLQLMVPEAAVVEGGGLDGTSIESSNEPSNEPASEPSGSRSNMPASDGAALQREPAP